MGRKGCYQHGSSAEYTRQAKPRKESGMSAEQTAVSLVPMTPNKMALVSPMLEKAQSLTVATKDDAALARAFGKELNAMIATIKADFEKPKKATDEAHKAVVAQEKSHLDPLNVAKEVVSGKITAWDGAERKRIEEERRLLAQEDERKRQAILEWRWRGPSSGFRAAPRGELGSPQAARGCCPRSTPRLAPAG